MERAVEAMNKVISYCLWGTDAKYLDGMMRNIELATEIYPGWDMNVVVGSDLGNAYAEGLVRYGIKHNVRLVAWLSKRADWTLMLDRFWAITFRNVDVMISRDADSRLSLREKAAVDEWLESDKGVHVMHDHPWHTVPMLGGMWGCKSDAIPAFKERLDAWPVDDKWQTDQEFLTKEIWPLVKDDTLNHDEFFRQVWGGKAFPLPRKGYEFVGATVDENEQYVDEQINELRKYVR